MKDDDALQAQIFDLEADLIEFMQTTSDVVVRPQDAALVNALARWALSRGAVAPMKRG
jgi:hypothetical protein